MNKSFINKDFLLQNKSGRELYHQYASNEPIIDYHCHLPPEQIADNVNFKNLTNIWLDGDHYKWRAMRTCGVDEYYITGDASDKEKFFAWANTVPKTLKNPLYHWTHMELNFPFGIHDRLLNGDSAEYIWNQCNEMLQKPEFSTRELLKRNNVKVVATTDDPTDSLEFHKRMRDGGDNGFTMVPTFRPDRGMEIENGEEFREWVSKLEKVSGITITSFRDFLDALKQRHDLFDELGCRASDHGIETPYGESFSDSELEYIFSSVMKTKSISDREVKIFKSAFLYFCGLMDHEKEWVFQIHTGALRNNNSRMMKKLGRDTGFDSIGDFEMARPLSRMLDRLDKENKLPRVVLYNHNPHDNELFVTMAGNFQDGSVAGKIQYGPPWWFLDQKDGIEKQIESLSNMGLLSQFIGMTTDSRSFLSFSRHDYFRRILCNVIGDDLENCLIPDNPEMISELIKNICYNNADQFFRFNK